MLHYNENGQLVMSSFDCNSVILNVLFISINAHLKAGGSKPDSNENQDVSFPGEVGSKT